MGKRLKPGWHKCRICRREQPPGKLIRPGLPAKTPTGGEYMRTRWACWEHRNPDQGTTCRQLLSVNQKAEIKKKESQRWKDGGMSEGAA